MTDDGKSYWCIFESETDHWWTDAEEIDARNAEEAAEKYISDFGDGDEDDCDEVDIIVASDRAGTDAKRISVVCYVERSYCATGASSDDVELPPDGPNEHFDMDDDEADLDAPERPKGMQDDATLSLFD